MNAAEEMVVGAARQAAEKGDVTVLVASLLIVVDNQQAAIQRVRELHREHVCDWASAPFACFIVHGGECAHRGKCRICHAEKCDTIRTLDGDA